MDTFVRLCKSYLSQREFSDRVIIILVSVSVSPNMSVSVSGRRTYLFSLCNELILARIPRSYLTSLKLRAWRSLYTCARSFNKVQSRVFNGIVQRDSSFCISEMSMFVNMWCTQWKNEVTNKNKVTQWGDLSLDGTFSSYLRLLPGRHVKNGLTFLRRNWDARIATRREYISLRLRQYARYYCHLCQNCGLRRVSAGENSTICRFRLAKRTLINSDSARYLNKSRCICGEQQVRSFFNVRRV